MSEVKVKRAVCRKPYHHNKNGKRITVPVGDIVEVTPEQAMAFPENLVAPEVLLAQQAADKAVREAEEAARTAKNNALKGITAAEEAEADDTSTDEVEEEADEEVVDPEADEED